MAQTTTSETRIEVIRPKSVPEGLLALGVVVEVSEIQIKIQITGGIICIVDRLNVSQSFSELVENSEKPPRLSHIFSKGQRYVCKIIEKRARKGYSDAQDIIASLDPTCIQEDNIPASLLAIPFVPLQCAISSTEDHGYQVDIGFKGLTGFLPFEEANEYQRDHNDGKKFIVGQIVRCCVLKPLIAGSGARVVQLSMTEFSMRASAFSRDKVTGNALTEKCILPGSKSFSTVMEVRKNGLIVNFMNEFAGFVSANHLRDEWHSTKDDYKISQQLDCTVLYFNHLTKTFALSIRSDSKYDKTMVSFLKKYHVGKVIKNAEFVSINGTSSVVFKIDKTFKAIANVMDAIDDEVATMTKDELQTALDASFPDNSKHKCRIKSINYLDQILVVSLKKEFLDLPYVSVNELKAGDFIEAKIKKVIKDGVQVTFGLNLRGIILNMNLNDIKSFKKYPAGKTIKCRVLKVDMHKQPPRVYLTNKDQLMDSQMTIVDSYDKTFKGESTNATILKVSTSGLIVELFNNVKGYIPRIFLSSEDLRKTNIGNLFETGQVISCVVYRVDPVRPSLLLGLIPLEQIIKMKREKKESRKANKKKKIEAKLDQDVEEAAEKSQIKSRRQRSEEARIREEKLREAERSLMDPNRPPQSIPDFERSVLKTPNASEAWIQYSKYFLDNIETEKARIVCRRALRTVSFREEKEKLKIWLQLVKIEARYGDSEKLYETIGEASQVSDKVALYKGASKILATCGKLEDAERLHKMLIKLNNRSVDLWLDYISFLMEHRDLSQAREQFDIASKFLLKTDLINLKSRFGQLEFRLGDVERGKTIFENLLSDNPKRTDLWRVFEGMVKKYGLRQVDNEEQRAQNENLMQRIAESITLVSKKSKKQEKKKSPPKKRPAEGEEPPVKSILKSSNAAAKRVRVV